MDPISQIRSNDLHYPVTQNPPSKNLQEAQFNLALDYAKAGLLLDSFDMIKSLALKGYSRAQRELAGIYYRGNEAITKDRQQALYWFTEAANGGSVEAKFCLGFLYQQGEDVQQDFQTAMKWYMLAAEQKNAAACYCIGNFYREGLGVKKNYPEALNWYKNADALGHKSAPKAIKVIEKKMIDLAAWREGKSGNSSSSSDESGYADSKKIVWVNIG